MAVIFAYIKPVLVLVMSRTPEEIIEKLFERYRGGGKEPTAPPSTAARDLIDPAVKNYTQALQKLNGGSSGAPATQSKSRKIEFEVGTPAAHTSPPSADPNEPIAILRKQAEESILIEVVPAKKTG